VWRGGGGGFVDGLRIREGLVQSGGSRVLELRLRDRYRDGPTQENWLTIAAVYWIE